MILSLQDLLQSINAHRLKTALIAICVILFAGGAIAYQTSGKEENTAMTTTEITQPVKNTSTDLLQGQWKYMPGITRTSTGLTIDPKRFAIVNQDGSTAQLNPPINLAGTHLENIKGDFSITAGLTIPTTSQATIQYYGQVPIIADEFRVERESVQISINQTLVTIRLFTPSTSSAQNQNVHAFTYTSSGQAKTLTMSRIGNVLHFSVNNKEIGTLADPGIFKKGSLWIGLDGQNQWSLQQLTATKLAGGSFSLADASTVTITHHDPQGIQALASKKRPGFVVGGAMALGPLTTDPTYASVALDKNTFGSMTPENGMKMINLQPQRGVYTFQHADALVALAKQNGLTVHGHTLVFAEANPPWFNALPVTTQADKDAIKQIMIDHIRTVVTHFKDSIQEWDVINEPLDDDNNLRAHKWEQAMGESYIITALDTAHKANPNATLFINEYGLEANGDRWDTFVDLLNRLKPQLTAHNIPLSKIAVGFQAHVYEAGDKIDPDILRSHIQQLGNMGFKTQISEMDVYSDDGDTVQAQQYQQVFNACISEPNCIAWRTWIISDRYDYWKDDNGNIETGVDGLFDANVKPRPGYTAIQSLLK